ncbi:hypothetical protein [Arcticibacter tournemirensis]
MELFILLHSDIYEASDGKIIACSLFRENLTDRMNKIANAENQKILEFASLNETASPRLYVYNEIEDSWVKRNGRSWTERLSIERFDMI